MRPILLSLVLLTGCDSYLSTQVQLTEQARKGVELCRQSQTQRRQAIGQLYDLQRQRLDEAFDADVREQLDFSTQWILDHRKAYAAALDLLHAQRRAGEQADQAEQRNLQALDAALRQLLRIQKAQRDLVRSVETSGQ